MEYVLEKWKVLEKGFLSSGKPWNLVFASPGKKSILMSVRTLDEGQSSGSEDENELSACLECDSRP